MIWDKNFRDLCRCNHKSIPQQKQQGIIQKCPRNKRQHEKRTKQKRDSLFAPVLKHGRDSTN